MPECVPARSVSCYAPAVRTVLVVVWPVGYEDGVETAEYEIFQVVGVETVVDRNGDVWREPQIVVEGRLLSLTEAEDYFEPGSQHALATCEAWDPQMDDVAISGLVQDLGNRVLETARVSEMAARN